MGFSKTEHWVVVEEMRKKFEEAGIDVPKSVLTKVVEETLPDGTMVFENQE